MICYGDFAFMHKNIQMYIIYYICIWIATIHLKQTSEKKQRKNTLNILKIRNHSVYERHICLIPCLLHYYLYYYCCCYWLWLSFHCAFANAFWIPINLFLTSYTLYGTEEWIVGCVFSSLLILHITYYSSMTVYFGSCHSHHRRLRQSLS